MKVKYSLAIALSHDAQLLILDEPTSGLDPVSRDEILDIFREIVKNGNKAILFSTHITSDLDKCATNITYINNGSIIYTGEKDEFLNSVKQL
jgi:ABC-2 type transport system ATP-binding protein